MKRAYQEERRATAHTHTGYLLGKHLAPLCSVNPPVKRKNLGSLGLTVRRHGCTKLLNLQHFQLGLSSTKHQVI